MKQRLKQRILAGILSFLMVFTMTDQAVLTAFAENLSGDETVEEQGMENILAELEEGQEDETAPVEFEEEQGDETAIVEIEEEQASDIQSVESEADLTEECDTFLQKREAEGSGSGKIGKNNGISWTYQSSTKTLELSGTDELESTSIKINKIYFTESPLRKICEEYDVEKIVFNDCKITGEAAYLCYYLPNVKEIDTSGIDVSDVRNFNFMFAWNRDLEKIDLSGMQISDEAWGFNDLMGQCNNLTTIITPARIPQNISGKFSLPNPFKDSENNKYTKLDNTLANKTLTKAESAVSAVDLKLQDGKLYWKPSKDDFGYDDWNHILYYQPSADLAPEQLVDCSASGVYTTQLDNERYFYDEVNEYINDNGIYIFYLKFDSNQNENDYGWSDFCVREYTRPSKVLDTPEILTDNKQGIATFRAVEGAEQYAISLSYVKKYGNTQYKFPVYSRNFTVKQIDANNCNYLEEDGYTVTWTDAGKTKIRVDYSEVCREWDNNEEKWITIPLDSNIDYYFEIRAISPNVDECANSLLAASGGPVNLPDKPVTGITLNEKSLALNMGQEKSLIATVAPSNASNPSIAWSSSDTSVATVNSTGKVTAVGTGTATITASAKDGSGKSASCTVKVYDYAFYDISDDSSTQEEIGIVDEITIDVSEEGGYSLFISNAGNPYDSGALFTYVSDNPAVAAVLSANFSPGGTKISVVHIDPKMKGETTIWATSPEGIKISLKVRVTNDFLSDIYFSEPGCTMKRFEKKELRLYCTPSDSGAVNNDNITWESDNEHITVTKGDNLNAVIEVLPPAYRGETATITATLSYINKNGEEEKKVATYSVLVKGEYYESELRPAGNWPMNLKAVTNVTTKLSEIRFTNAKGEEIEGWSWDDENLVLANFIGIVDRSESVPKFAATYKGDETHDDLKAQIPVELTSLDSAGITLFDKEYDLYSNDKSISSLITKKKDESVTAIAMIDWNMSGVALSQYKKEDRDAILAAAKADNITWKSSNEKVLTVKKHPSDASLAVLKTGEKPGTATITATIPIGVNENGKASKTFTAKVAVTVKDVVNEPAQIDYKKAGGEIALPDGIEKINLDEFTAVLSGTAAENTKELAFTMASPKGLAKNYTLSATSNSAAVATVKCAKNAAESGKEADGVIVDEYTVTLTLKTAGVAKITLKANDEYGTTKEFLLYVNDPNPVLLNTATEINTRLNQDNRYGTFTLRENSGYEVTGVELIAKTAKDDDTEFFTKTLTRIDDTDDWKVTLADGFNGKMTTYKKLQLKITVTKDGEEIECSKTIPISIKVSAVAPSYTVKQGKKVNLFYYKETGHNTQMPYDGELTITPKTKLEKEVELKDCDYELVLKEDCEDLTQYYIKAKMGTDKSGKEVLGFNKKGTLKLTFEGYEETVTKAVTITTENKAPKITADKKAVTFYPALELTSTSVYLLADGVDIRDPWYEANYGKIEARLEAKNTRDSASVTSDYSFVEEYGVWKLSLTNMTNPKASLAAKIVVEGADWTKPLNLDYTIKTNIRMPALSLSKTTVTLNANPATWAADGDEITLKWADGSDFHLAATKITLVPSNEASRAVMRNSIDYSYDEDRDVLSLGMLKGEFVQLNKNATYKYKVTAEVGDGNKVVKEITVKVINKAPAVTLTQKGSINVLNREGSPITLTPKLSNMNGCQDSRKPVLLTGSGAEFFKAKFNDQGQIELRLKEDVPVSTKYTYKVKVNVPVHAYGETIYVEAKELNIKPVQTKPTLKASGKNVIYSGVYNQEKVTFSADYKTGGAVINTMELVKGDEYFYYNPVASEIIPKKTLAVKGTYTLQFKYVLKGQAVNEKPYTINYKVVVK